MKIQGNIFPKTRKLSPTLIALLAIMLSLTLQSKAQETNPASGGEAFGAGGKVSYTIGQIVYTTASSMSGSMAQGVQQPWEITVVSAEEEASEISLEINAYPNPTTGFLNLKVESFPLDNLSYQIFDLRGVLLKSQTVENGQSRINMEDLANSVYILKVIQGDRDVKVFRIVKH